MRNKDDIEAILREALYNASAPHTQAEYVFRKSLATRIGENAITQNMGGEEEYLRIFVAHDKRQGSSITNKLEEKSIGTMIKRAEEISENSPHNPEYMPPIKPQTLTLTLAATPILKFRIGCVRICVDFLWKHRSSLEDS